MLDNCPISPNAIVPVDVGVSDAGRVIQVVFLELGAATQMLVESFRSRDLTLDDCPHGQVGAFVQVLVHTGHAAVETAARMGTIRR